MASATTLTFTFTPSGDTPAEARPPEGWAGVVVRGENSDSTNPIGGYFEGVDTTGVPPGGTHQGPWVYDYDAANILLESDFDNHYYTNGTGGYYAIAIPPTDCDPADTLVNENATEPITYDAACGEWEIGTLTYNVYADGNCSFYDVTVGSSYNAGVIGTCNGNTYSVDSSGTVTSEPIISGYEGDETHITIPTGASVLSGTRVRPQYASGGVGEWTPWNYTTSGTLYGSDSSYNYYADGAGSYTSEPVTPPPPPPCDLSGTDLGVDPNDSCNNLYADGTCGTYTNSNGSCDGGGGGGGGGGCDSAGIMVSTGLTADLYITTPCGEVTAGTRTYNVYTDGSCGTTEQTTNEAWSSNGTELNSCSSSEEDCTYYADGEGSYTSSCTPIEPPPDECESDSLHVEGEDGWTYDGCNWSQGNWTEEFPDAGEPYPGETDFPENDTAGGNENAPPHEEGTGIAYENAFINGAGNWDINFV
jgi:hypothetical protein